MSSGVLDLGIQEGLHLKREYSKSGCRECKRRKIKCDEDKPCCWQCLRLRKECTYPAAGEKVARVSKKKWKQILGRDPGREMNGKVKREKYIGTVEVKPEQMDDEPIRKRVEEVPTNPRQPQQAQAFHRQAQISQQQAQQSLRAQQPAQHPAQQEYQPMQPQPSPQKHLPVHQAKVQHMQQGLFPPQNHLHQQPIHPLYKQPIPPQYQSPGHPVQYPVPPGVPNSFYPYPRYYDQNHRNSFTQVPLPRPQGSMQRGSFADVPKGTHLSPNAPPFLYPQTSPVNSQANPEVPQIYQFQNSPKYATSSIVNLLNDVPKDHPSPISSFSSPNLPQGKQVQLPDNDMLLYFDQEDLNLLATDLNNFVHSIVIDSNLQTKVDFDHASASSGSNGFSLKASSNSTPMGQSMDTTMNHMKPAIVHNLTSRNIPLDYIKLKKLYERLYLEEFFNNFASLILPFEAYDKATNRYYNPARDIILKAASNEPFLLAAVLAHGAKLSYQKHNLPEDEEAYCTYLSKCLKLLGPALNSSGNRDLASNIETVLLTVLLLTSANAANTKQDWRPHLRGAKDLLLKNAMKEVQNSHILIFCKCWFVTLEILAGLSSTLGGTLQTDQEIDLLIKLDDEYEIAVLKQLGCILDNGFNIFVGYHIECVGHLRDMIKMSGKHRRLKEERKGIKNEGFEKEQYENPFRPFELISNFYIEYQREFVNKKSVLTLEDYPEGIPEGVLLDVIKLGEKSILVSWMDFSHQSYVLAAMITILTKFFRELYDSPQVQMLTKKLVSLVDFSKDTSEPPPQEFKCALMMVQWPMLVAAMNCIDEDYRFVMMKFFRISAQIGSGSASFTLRKISKVWKMRDRGETYSSDDEDGEDVLSY